MAETHSSVEYRDIPGFPGYRVGNDGSVWSSWENHGSSGGRVGDWKKLKPQKSTTGYPCVRIRFANALKKTRKVHHLILETFRGPRPNGMECRHLDGNPMNSDLSNLQWGTHAENILDTIRHGRSLKGIARVKGSRHGKAKLREPNIPVIRRLFDDGKTQKHIAVIFNVNVSTIKDVLAGRTWRHVA